VQSPDVDDNKKLMRVGSYLNETKDLKLTLQALSSFIGYIDKSYAVHQDGKGRTGNLMTLGRGSVKNSSTRHSIVCKSYTEAEIVGVTDGLGHNIVLMYLLEE
jgi:hypothetical protein